MAFGGLRQDPLTTMLSHEEAQAFYDRFGAKQDSQAFYEDAATDDLLAHAAFDRARSVFEFGCGTGRFAEKLLERHLSNDARYLGVDISQTMVDLACARLRPFGTRAVVQRGSGEALAPMAAGTADRFVSNYVLDLLGEEDIRSLVLEAQRVLVFGGLLCLTSLTEGRTPLLRLVSTLWQGVHRLRPSLVGGCRPVRVTPFLDRTHWEVRHANVVTRFGLSSEVVVAANRGL